MGFALFVVGGLFTLPDLKQPALYCFASHSTILISGACDNVSWEVMQGMFFLKILFGVVSVFWS